MGEHTTRSALLRDVHENSSEIGMSCRAAFLTWLKIGMFGGVLAKIFFGAVPNFLAIRGNSGFASKPRPRLWSWGRPMGAVLLRLHAFGAAARSTAFKTGPCDSFSKLVQHPKSPHSPQPEPNNRASFSAGLVAVSFAMTGGSRIWAGNDLSKAQNYLPPPPVLLFFSFCVL